MFTFEVLASGFCGFLACNDTGDNVSLIVFALQVLLFLLILLQMLILLQVFLLQYETYT